MRRSDRGARAPRSEQSQFLEHFHAMRTLPLAAGKPQLPLAWWKTSMICSLVAPLLIAPRMWLRSSSGRSNRARLGAAMPADDALQVAARVLGHKKCVQINQVSSCISKKPPFPICEFSRRQRGRVNQAVLMSLYSEAAKDSGCLGVARSHISGSRNLLRERSSDVNCREMRLAES